MAPSDFAPLAEAIGADPVVEEVGELPPRVTELEATLPPPVPTGATPEAVDVTMIDETHVLVGTDAVSVEYVAALLDASVEVSIESGEVVRDVENAAEGEDSRAEEVVTKRSDWAVAKAASARTMIDEEYILLKVKKVIIARCLMSECSCKRRMNSCEWKI